MPAQVSNHPRKQRIGRYPVERFLGSGGMADVYLGRQVGMGGFDRLVVIKQIREELRERNDVVYMFLDEARIAAQINHPNVVQIYDIDEEGGLPFLVMEYVRGLSFASLLEVLKHQQQQMPVELAAGLGMQVCAGLHAAHELRDLRGEPLSVVHRDVSPQNLMVSVDGIVKIIDFGVARAKNRLSSTVAGQLKGNLAYTAPETLTHQGGSPLFDRRADLFSLGVVLYEMCCGKELFTRETVIGTMSAVLFTQVPPLCGVRPDASPEMEAVLQKTLSNEPEARPQTAAELGRTLQTIAIQGAHFVTPQQIGEWLLKTAPDECAELLHVCQPSSQQMPLAPMPRAPVPFVEPPVPAPAPPAISEPMALPTAMQAPTRLLPGLSDISRSFRTSNRLRLPMLILVGLLGLVLLGLGVWQLR